MQNQDCFCTFLSSMFVLIDWWFAPSKNLPCFLSKRLQVLSYTIIKQQQSVQEKYKSLHFNLLETGHFSKTISVEVFHSQEQIT